MAKVPWFKFYAQDWLSDSRVLTMTAEERGVYIHLLCLDHHEGGIPEDDVLPSICKASASVCLSIASVCFTSASSTTGKRSHPKIEEQRKEGLILSKKRATAGRKGGKKPGKTTKTREHQANSKQVLSKCLASDKQLQVDTDTDTDILSSTSTAEKNGGDPNFPDDKTGGSNRLNAASGDRPSLAEVQEWASMHIGTPKEWVEKWWLEVESAGWLDFRQRPVTNWQAYFTGMHRHWENKGKPDLGGSIDRSTNPADAGKAKAVGEQKGNSSGRGASSTAYALRTKKEAAEESLRALINGASHDAMGPMLSPEEKAERKRLKNLIADCNRRIGDLEIE